MRNERSNPVVGRSFIVSGSVLNYVLEHGDFQTKEELDDFVREGRYAAKILNQIHSNRVPVFHSIHRARDLKATISYLTSKQNRMVSLSFIRFGQTVWDDEAVLFGHAKLHQFYDCDVWTHVDKHTGVAIPSRGCPSDYLAEYNEGMAFLRDIRWSGLFASRRFIERLLKADKQMGYIRHMRSHGIEVFDRRDLFYIEPTLLFNDWYNLNTERYKDNILSVAGNGPIYRIYTKLSRIDASQFDALSEDPKTVHEAVFIYKMMVAIHELIDQEWESVKSMGIEAQHAWLDRTTDYIMSVEGV